MNSGRTLVMLHHINWVRNAGERPIYVFGAGGAGQQLIEYLRTVDVKIAGIVDNDKSKWEKTLLGLRVHGPEILHPGIFVIIGSAYGEEIAQQLNNLGFIRNTDYADDYEVCLKTLGKYDFVNNLSLLSDAPEFIKEWEEKAGTRTLVIFGAEQFARDLDSMLSQYGFSPRMFLDKDESKWGNIVQGLPVTGLNNIEDNCFILVASLEGREIAQQLVDRGLLSDVDFVVIEPSSFYEKFSKSNSLPDAPLSQRLPDGLFEQDDMESNVHFFIHNSAHAGDVILTRPFITELQKAFPLARITLECIKPNEYLWADLKFPIITYNGRNYFRITPTPNCPDGAVFINIWFGIFPDILNIYGLSYANSVHTFNRFMIQYRLQNKFQLYNKKYTPMVEFYQKMAIPLRVRDNSILVENGEVFSSQSNFELSNYLEELVNSFPNINFYCAASPKFKAPNVIDCSSLTLIELSEVGNRCSGFLTRGSGVNAATYTENNRYKPRCVLGWTAPFEINWHALDNPPVLARTISEVEKFLLSIVEDIIPPST